MTQQDDIMALVFGGATVEKTTTIHSSHDESSTHVEKTLTVTKSFTHDSSGDHVTVEVHREVGAEDHGEEIYKHSSATFEAHVETSANGEHHLQLDSISLHKDVELPNGEEIGVEVHLREAPAAELGDRSPSRLSTATDATSILADTYHVHPHEEQEVNVHLGDEHDEHHDRDHIPFRNAQQDALVAQFKELHTAPPLPTSAPPSEHVSRRGTYIEETSILDDPIEIDREHELERIRIDAERVAELKRTLSKASDVAHLAAAHRIHQHQTEDYSSDEEGSVVPLSATHYEFDDRASIARTESFLSQQSAKRDSIDIYHEHEHEHHEHPIVHEAAEVAQYVERKHSEAMLNNNEPEPHIGSGASPIHVVAPVTSPLQESVFMSPVSPVPHDDDSRTSSLNPRFSGPHIRDSIKAVEVLEHEHEINAIRHHHHHEHVAARHDSIASAGSVARALQEMDHALTGHHDSSSVPPSPAPSRDDGAYSLNGSVRHKHHLYERMDSYSRSSTPSGPPPPVPLWDLIKEEENARAENVRDAPAPLHRAAPLSHLEEISSKNSVTTGSHHEHHDEASLLEAAAIAHHHHQHHDSQSLQGSVRSTSSRYGSKHSLAQNNIGAGAAPAAIGAGVAPARKYTADSNHSSCKSRGTSITLVEDAARSRGSTLTEANVNGVHAHEHHHHTLGEVVAAHLIAEHIERRVEEEIVKEIIHQHQEQSTIAYEHQKPVDSLLSKFGGGKKKAYTKEEADVRRREIEAEQAAVAAVEHARREAERHAAEEAAALAAAHHAAEAARLAAIRAVEEEAARHAAQVAAAAAIHHHEQQQAAAAAAHHGHSRTASVVSHRSAASYHVPPTPTDAVAPIASRRDSYASVRTTRSVMGYRGAASRDPFATLSRPPPQHHVIPGYTRNPMTSPSLVKKSPLHAAVDANKFSSVRVVRNVRGFIKEWGQKDFVPPARSPLSPTLAIWHEEDNNSRRSSIVSEGGQSLIGRPAHIQAAPRTITDVPPTPTDAVPLTPLVERRREYEHSASITGLVEEKHHNGLPPMVNLLA